MAHPHVFIDIAYEVHIKEGMIHGLYHQWTFSEEDTALLLLNMSQNDDGSISEEELAPMAMENVDALDDYQYFSDIILDGELIAPEKPLGASMRVEGNRLVMNFYLAFAEPVRPSESFVVDIYDPEIFIAFSARGQNPIRLSEAIPGCYLEYQIAEAPQYDVFSDDFLSQLQDANFALQFSQRAEIKCG